MSEDETPIESVRLGGQVIGSIEYDRQHKIFLVRAIHRPHEVKLLTDVERARQWVLDHHAEHLLRRRRTLAERAGEMTRPRLDADPWRDRRASGLWNSGPC